MRKFAYRFKLKAKDACRDAGNGLLKAALCLTAIAGSAIAAWAAPTSLKMYVESGNNTGVNNPREVLEMKSAGENTFTADFVCMSTPYSNAMGLLFVDSSPNRDNWYWSAGQIELDKTANFNESQWYAPSTQVQNVEVGTTYTVTVGFPNGGNQGNITVTRAAVQQEVEFTRTVKTLALKLSSSSELISASYDGTTHEFTAIYNQKADDVISFIVNGDKEYRSADWYSYDKPDATNTFKSSGALNNMQAGGNNVGWRKVVVKEIIDGSLKAVFCETEEPVVEFKPIVESVKLRLVTDLKGNTFYRDVEVPYNAETGEFAGDFLLSHKDQISFVVNGAKIYNQPSYISQYGDSVAEYSFVENGTNVLNATYDNFGWRHVVLKENVDHSLKAVFSKSEYNPTTLADATLKVVKPDGTVKDAPMVLNGLSWSAKDVPLEVGDKPYVQFSDGIYVKYDEGVNYVFETKKPGNKSMPLAQMAEKPVNMDEFPAVTKAGQFTFTFYYVLNDNAIYTPLYLSRKIATLEDPEMSVWRDGKGGEPEFVSLMDFVLLEKLADAVVKLKAGETIFLKYGEDEIPVQLANVESFAGEHAVSDATVESTRLTVPEDGTYRLRLDMKDGRKLVVENITMPEQLWYIPGDFNSVSEEALNGKIALVPAKDNAGKVQPGKYVSETEIELNSKFFITDSVDKFYTKDSDGNTVFQNISGQPDYALGGSYNPNAKKTKFEPGKKVLLLDWIPDTGSKTSPFTVADNVITAAEKHLMYVDIATDADKTLRWGNIMDYKGKDYYLIGCDGKGTLTNGSSVDSIPGTIGNEKYKFLYHPTTNLYTLTLDEVWGKLAIDTNEGGNLGRYTAIKNNELINTIGRSYDLYYSYTDDGEHRSTKPYTDDEGNVLPNEDWNYFVINDPQYADDMVKVQDAGQIAYCYYKDITIVFDPDNNRLWMQSPNKDFEYDPTKDPVNIEQPLYIVFCRKVSDKDTKDAYEVVKVRPMIQSKRKDLSHIPEYALGEVVDGSKAKTSAPRRAAMRHADATSDANEDVNEEESKGVTYGYYTTGYFGSYDGRYIDPTNAGWCHPESWPSPDSFTDILVKPGGVTSTTEDNKNGYVAMDYQLAYFFFSETDGEEYATVDEKGFKHYDINKMLDYAVHLHCDQEAVVENNLGYMTWDTTTTTTTTTTINGSENETAPRFFNQDFTSGIQATRKILNEQHAAGNQECSSNHLGMHLIAIDSTQPFYVELDRSGAQANTRVTRAENTLYFVAYYQTPKGENKYYVCPMTNKDPETGEVSNEYPYYYESEEWLPLKDFVWESLSDKIENPNVYGRCNFFFSSQTADNLRDIITRSLNASALVTTDNPFDSMKMEMCYDEEKLDSNGYALSNVQEMAHNFSRTFFNTNYEVGSGKALNYFKLDFGDQFLADGKENPNYDKGDKVYKVRLWLKGSVKAPPVDPFVTKPSNAPRMQSASYDPLEVSKVQLISTTKDNIKTGLEEVAEEAPRVTVNGHYINVEGGKHVIVVDTQGRLMYTGEPRVGIEVAGRGIYIVNVDGDATKVIVR